MLYDAVPVMEQILIACGDVELLRRIVADLPQGKFKPIATKTGAGIAQKIAGRGVALAVVHEKLADDTAAQLCQELGALDDRPAILYLTAASPPSDGPFDRALRYPVPGPILRNAIGALAAGSGGGHDLERWRQFYRELKARLEGLDDQDYFRVLGVKRGAPHHKVQKAYDLLSVRYHPDRYRQFRDEKWGQAIYDKTTQLYKVISEAYNILSDRKLRQAYERALARGELRLDPQDQAAQDTGPKPVTALGNTSASKKFLKLAHTELAKGDLASALQNLKFAHSMEPDNQALADKIAEVEAKLG